MMDLKCEHAVIDVVSSLGTEQNVTQHVTKHNLDAEGVRARYSSRNKEQHDIILSDTLVVETLEELHENGEDAISLDPQTLQFARDEYDFLFVDYYASWCSHCKELAPTWEVLAEAMTEAAEDKVDQLFEHQEKEYDYTDQEYQDALKVEMPVMVAKIDCVQHKDLCTEDQIWAYPTLRLFVNGEPVSEYHGDRTVLEMIHWLGKQEEEHKKDLDDDDVEHKVAAADEVARDILSVEETREEMVKKPEREKHHKSTEQEQWAEKMKTHWRRERALDWKDSDHPGCQLSGFLWIDRVPGHFHIQARSPVHDIAAHMTNVSHEVHHLSIGTPRLAETITRQRNTLDIPKDFESTLSPIDGNVYVNHNEHESFHHYLKVVTTEFSDINDGKSSRYTPDKLVAYQILSSSQLSFYRSDVVPSAKFSYDPSPIAVHYRGSSKKHWYDYITSLMAIVGGMFTIVGMLENTIYAATSKKRF